MGNKVRVLVVDDSALCRELIQQALSRDPDLRVVDMCSNGADAVERVARLKPDVVTMDVEMPVMDGLEAVERIMSTHPTPILVVTADPSGQASQLTYRALELGALALQVKPSVDEDYESWALAREVKLLSTVKVIRHVHSRHGISEVVPVPGTSATHRAVPRHRPAALIAIGCSTGGPQLLHRTFRSLPADFPTPIVVVQHINPSFAESLATWLGSVSKLEIRLAQNGDTLVPGRILIAPPGMQLVTPTRGKVALRPGEPRDGHIPSATMLMESVARVYGREGAGVLLTGMGADGAEGLLAMRRAGARTVAQSRESCVVFGMPGTAVELGAVEQLVHADALPIVLQQLAYGDDFST